MFFILRTAALPLKGQLSKFGSKVKGKKSLLHKPLKLKLARMFSIYFHWDVNGIRANDKFYLGS